MFPIYYKRHSSNPDDSYKVTSIFWLFHYSISLFSYLDHYTQNYVKSWILIIYFYENNHGNNVSK